MKKTFDLPKETIDYIKGLAFALNTSESDVVSVLVLKFVMDNNPEIVKEIVNNLERSLKNGNI